MDTNQSMEAYVSFASVYDLFMDNVPYDEWADYLLKVLRAEGIEDGLVLDLGCGTGKLTRIFAEAGYDMIGVDNSMEMLEIARQKETQESNILYLCQDMREFELYGTVRAIYSACDCMNYLLEEDEILATFKLANNYLDPKGLFLFDMNTPYKYEEILADETFAENRVEGSFVWENYFDEESQINEYELTLFVREEDDRYRKFNEIHYQRSYQIERIKELIAQSGMELVGVYDAYTQNPVHPESERVLFVAREYRK